MWKQKHNDEEICRNRKLIARHPYLKPFYVGKMDYRGEYDYSYTELDALPKGWRIAFGEQLCEGLTEALTRAGLLDDYGLLEVKEKYGSLRWYDHDGNEETRDIIRGYERLSAAVCVGCGARATRLSKGWILPFCTPCFEKQSTFKKFTDIIYEEEDEREFENLSRQCGYNPHGPAGGRGDAAVSDGALRESGVTA